MDETEIGAVTQEDPQVEKRRTFWKNWVEGKSPEEIGNMLAQKEAESERDPLTGLLNKRGFTNRVEEELSKKRGKYYSVLFLDLNYLGQINDLVGHEEGNYWVKMVADALRSSSRPQDLCGRWTQGDEFIMFLPETFQVEAETIWRTIEKNFQPSFLISGGVARNPGNLSFEQTVELAEKAMYGVKQGKKGLVT